MEEFILENRKWELCGFQEKRAWSLEKLCTIALLLVLMAAAVMAGRGVVTGFRFPSAVVPAQPQAAYAQTPKMLDMEQSLALGNVIGTAVGAEYDMISYTDTSTCFMDSDLSGGVHLLTLSNISGDLQYRTNKAPEIKWSCGTREQLLDALQPFALPIPDSAVFTCEGSGWHCFAVEGTAEGEYFLKGTVRCRYAQDGTIKQLESDLRSYPLRQPEAGEQTVKIDPRW